jgi:spermidine synthase
MYRKLVKCIKLRAPYKIKLVNGKEAIVEAAWRSPYQLIEIVNIKDTKGRVWKGLFLDGEVQFIEGDIDREYHIKGHISNYPQKKIEKVAILGGGDGKLAGYLLKKYPNADIYVLELDPCMIHVFKSYYPHLNNYAFNNPRVHTIIGDAYDSLANFPNDYFDLIIVDLPDIINPDRYALYSEDKIELIAKKLKKGGYLAFYTGGVSPEAIVHITPKCLQVIKIVPVKGFLGAIGFVVHFRKISSFC